VSVQPGEQVAPGDVVAALESAFIDAEIAVVTAEFERLRRAVVPQRADWLEPVQRLSGEVERAAVELEQIRAEEGRDRAALEQVNAQVQRQRELLAERLVTSDQLHELLLQQASLTRKVEDYPRILALIQRHRDAAAGRLAALGKAPDGGAALRDSNGSSPHGSTDGADAWLSSSRLAVDVQARRLDQLRKERENLVLRSPISGRVEAVLLRPGDVAAPDTPILTVVAHEPDRVVAYVDEREALRLHVGARATLRPQDLSGPPRTGEVVSLGASISELPIRLRRIPARPSWGREVVVLLTKGEQPFAPLPGQVFHVTFLADPSAKGV
jgi:HlyD family secretion protein